MLDSRKSIIRCCALASAVISAAGLPSCISAPTPEYVASAPIMQKRAELHRHLISMLPAEQQSLPEAQAEAKWLADTAYKAAAGIARVNKPIGAGWLNNYLVNSPFHFKERGLCWHYQNDLYRELRRRQLKYFRVGCCVRDQGNRHEHHCIYLCPKDTQWPHVYVLDAWRYHGKLKVMEEKDLEEDDWKDEVGACLQLSQTYPECHSFPIEHWAMVRSDYKWKIYVPSASDEGRNNRQGKIMRENMRKGLQERNGRLTNY